MNVHLIKLLFDKTPFKEGRKSELFILSNLNKVVLIHFHQWSLYIHERCTSDVAL